MPNPPYNPEQSPESMPRNGERPPEELDPRWDDLAAEYGDQAPEASPEEWAEKMGQMPEFAEKMTVYEKVTIAPVYGVDAEGDDFNHLMTDFLAKGFWLKPKEYAPESGPLNTTEAETQIDDMTEGQTTEAGSLKYESLSESGISKEAAVGVFENSKRADFGASELANVTKGVPELSGSITELMRTTYEIEQMLKNGASPEDLRAKYAACLDITNGVHDSLVRADVSVELSGAILSKTEALENNLRSALDSLDAKTGNKEPAEQPAEQIADQPTEQLTEAPANQPAEQPAVAPANQQTKQPAAEDRMQKILDLEEGIKELSQ